MATPSPPSSPSSSSNPNSTPPPPSQPPLSPTRTTVVALAAASSAAARKPQPLLWTHDETLLLIDAYKEKWYSLGRGPLKAGHWEEIPVAVSARSGVDRSATQCRHKIEKMRKRFRAERQRVGPASPWPYYSLMQELENSPTPISARPLSRLPPNASNEDDEEDEDEEDDGEEDEDRQNKSRSINYILRRPGTVNRFAAAAAAAAASGGRSWGYERRGKKKRRKVEEGEGGRAVAAEIRAFAERLMEMEKRKIEFAKEMERRRVEMEMRRLDFIQTSQSRLLHFVTNVFDSL